METSLPQLITIILTTSLLTITSGVDTFIVIRNILRDLEKNGLDDILSEKISGYFVQFHSFDVKQT